MSSRGQGAPMPVPGADVPRVAEHLFRQEAGKLISVLTGSFGIERLQWAEDVVQEALVRALQTWPYYGVPQNPAAWLTQTAKHLAVDLIRREKRFREKQPEIAALIEQRFAPAEQAPATRFDDEIKDNRLRLIFACCHPLLPLDAQVALALKTLCGFSSDEIAKAFLTTEVAIAKRLTRARQRIQQEHIPFEIPVGADLAPRLDGVLQVIYFLFNEGYKASAGAHLVRAELCYEAINLAGLLTGHPSVDQPRIHALLALMLLDAARLPGRTDDAGDILRLQDQDRRRWDREMINLGLQELARAASGERISEYHLQAGIAACHCTAPDYQSTDWRAILSHYDQWLRINDSPIVALNRAVALANVQGPGAGIAAVNAVLNDRQLQSYYLTYAVLGDLHGQIHDFAAAAQNFEKALRYTRLSSEQRFLLKHLRRCEAKVATARHRRG